MADFEAVHLAIDALLTEEGIYEPFSVFDAVPTVLATGFEAVPPYIVLGEPTMQPEVAGEAELDGSGELCTLTIHAWSAYNGKAECYEMRTWLRGKLHQVEVAGTWDVHEEFAEIFEESEGDLRLYHAVMRYRIRTL